MHERGPELIGKWWGGTSSGELFLAIKNFCCAEYVLVLTFCSMFQTSGPYVSHTLNSKKVCIIPLNVFMYSLRFSQKNTD